MDKSLKSKIITFIDDTSPDNEKVDEQVFDNDIEKINEGNTSPEGEMVETIFKKTSIISQEHIDDILNNKIMCEKRYSVLEKRIKTLEEENIKIKGAVNRLIDHAKVQH